MKEWHGLFKTCICSWICLNSRQARAISVHTPPLDLDSLSANPSSGLDFDSLTSNITSFGTIDPAFGFVDVFSGEQLRPIPCLLNSVNVALQLALDDFEGFLFETVYTLDSHPQVDISVIPDEQGGSIPRKYAVWGLNLAIGMSIPSYSSPFGVELRTEGNTSPI